jgi:hypothetical protein
LFAGIDTIQTDRRPPLRFDAVGIRGHITITNEEDKDKAETRRKGT